MIADIKDGSLVSVDNNQYKNESFFVSHKGYWIHWSAIKTDYQPTLKTIFVVVADADANCATESIGTL
jgi:hypothetical protein